jgi:hypothetical protein
LRNESGESILKIRDNNCYQNNYNYNCSTVHNSTMSSSDPHPGVLRRTSTLRSVIEHMPVVSREFAAAAMCKEVMMTTMDSNRTLSRRLDLQSRESCRNFAAAAASSRNFSSANLSKTKSRELGAIADEEEGKGGGDPSSMEGGGGCCGGVWKSFDQDPTAKGYAIVSG